MAENLYAILRSRGLVAQCTDTDEAIQTRLSTPVCAYAGFDPTADSFHVGNLVPIMGLYWLQQCGHRPLVLVGGATALVGDPSGKTESRQMLSRATIDGNVAALTGQLSRLLRFDQSPSGAVLVNNIDWLGSLNWIAMLREVGPHFSVNRMLSMDSVKGRMETGITFLEFNYMVMQAYDYLHLQRTFGCSLQMGGQEQWGNIVMGIELVRRLAGAEVAGLTFPLVTKADGRKFGKSEQGNIWLSAARTPVYDFYQFWRNTPDSDVRRYLGFFTTVPMPRIEELAHPGSAGINQAKELLAHEVTTLIHGAQAADQARDDARKAFGQNQDHSGDSIPHAPIQRAELEEGVGVLVLLTRSGLAQSTSEARRLIEGGGVRIHDRTVSDITERVSVDALHEGFVLLRAGKKRLFRFDATP